MFFQIPSYYKKLAYVNFYNDLDWAARGVIEVEICTLYSNIFIYTEWCTYSWLAWTVAQNLHLVSWKKYLAHYSKSLWSDNDCEKWKNNISNSYVKYLAILKQIPVMLKVTMKRSNLLEIIEFITISQK